MSITESDSDESTTTTNLFPTLTPQPSDQEDQHQSEHHYIRSIQSTLTIRQLKSLGLSFQLWPAATTLVNLLSLSSPSLLFPLPTAHPPRILELGSGTGLVGIAFAAALGCHVTLTDLPHVLPNLLFNSQTNSEVVSSRGGAVHVAALDWGVEADMEAIGREYDLIVGSDVVYYDHLYDPLLRTLRYFMMGGERRDVVFVMGHLKRWKREKAFFKKAKKDFDVSVIHKDEPCDGRRVGVVVYRFKPKVPRG